MTKYNATIYERGNGMPDVGDYVAGAGELYRVITMGPIMAASYPGGSDWCLAQVEVADWDECPEGADPICSCVVDDDNDDSNEHEDDADNEWHPSSYYDHYWGD